MIQLYLARHSETEWNIAGRMQGVGDSPLTDRGVKLAEALGRRLADADIDTVYASPMLRAQRTALIAMQNAGKTDFDEQSINIDYRIKEMEFGEFEGQKMTDVKEKYPEIAYNLWKKPENYIPPAGGETYEQVMSRVKSFLADIAVKYGDTDEEVNIFAVTHSVLLNAFWLAFEDLPIKYYRARQPVSQCSLSRAMYDGSWHLVCFGDERHLRGI